METTRSSTAQARPKSGGVAFPFKLGTKVGADGTNASTITLTSMPGVVTPKAEKPDAEVEITNNVMGGNRRRPDSLGGVNGRSGEIVMEAGEVVGGERPEPERFVTAMEVPTHPE